MNAFVANNWGWITTALILAPLLTIIGVMWLRAWHLSFGAWLKGIHVGLVDILLMQARHIDVTTLVNQLMVAKQNSLLLEKEQLVAHMLAGGNIRRVIAALVSAKRFAIPLTLERACAVDLVGQDPLQLIADTVHEVGKIPTTGIDSGSSTATKAPLNPASVLLQAAPGTAGTVINKPQVTARVSFPQGELDVVINARTVPKVGDRVQIASVDGITITVEPR